MWEEMPENMLNPNTRMNKNRLKPITRMHKNMLKPITHMLENNPTLTLVNVVLSVVMCNTIKLRYPPFLSDLFPRVF